MQKKLVVLAAIVVAGAVVVVVYARGDKEPQHHHPKPATTAHGTGIDRDPANASLIALLNAPEGATPCETAYLAIEAEQAQAKLRGKPSLFKWVAPKPDFLTACATLSETAQKCMMPRYRRDHEAECQAARPPSTVLEKLVVFAPQPEDPPLH